ncbi:MAG: hypothetical protein DHS20C05_23220 [Hyphococcus sp.]|nr:MAG: hypothetical protein DHS20C05_23220 [Marinicaulis sp.]
MAAFVRNTIFRAIFKFFVSLFAILLILIGIITTPTPIPFGIVFIALGFFLLAASAPDLLRWMRRRWRWLDRQLVRLEKKLPRWLAKYLRRSDLRDEKEAEEERGR